MSHTRWRTLYSTLPRPYRSRMKIKVGLNTGIRLMKNSSRQSDDLIDFFCSIIYSGPINEMILVFWVFCRESSAITGRLIAMKQFIRKNDVWSVHPWLWDRTAFALYTKQSTDLRHRIHRSRRLCCRHHIDFVVKMQMAFLNRGRWKPWRVRSRTRRWPETSEHHSIAVVKVTQLTVAETVRV